mgnify:CR=1 FL=1
MRKLVTCLVLIVLCSCATANTEIVAQEQKHPVCVLSEKISQEFQSQLNNMVPGSTSAIKYCGQLANPEQSLGIALGEAVLPFSDVERRHIFFILKFAREGDEWMLLARPELIVDFVYGQTYEVPSYPKKSIESGI